MKKLLLALGFVAIPASACNQGDLAGRWNLFLDDYSCLFTVQADGRANAGQCLQMAEDPNRTGTRAPIRGRLKMQKDCRVTGRLSTEDRDGRDIVMSFGQTRLARDLQSWHGLAYVGVGPNPAFDLGDTQPTSGDYKRFQAVFVE